MPNIGFVSLIIVYDSIKSFSTIETPLFMKKIVVLATITKKMKWIRFCDHLIFA